MVEEQAPSGWRFVSFARAGACSLPAPTLEAQLFRIAVSPTAALLNLESTVLDGLPGGEVEISAAANCTVTFTNEPVGSVELIRQSSLLTTTDQDWSFESAILGDPVVTMPANPAGSVMRERAHFPAVALGEHNISSLLGGGTCTAESSATDYQTTAAAAVGSEPSSEDLLPLGDASLGFVVEHARLTTIVFVAEPCGDVLSPAALSIRVLESEAGDFDGDVPLPSWHVSIDGTAGMANGVSDSRETDNDGEAHFGSVAPGIYTICSYPGSTHRAVGSVANDGQGEVDGACREAVPVAGDPAREDGVAADFFHEPVVVVSTPPVSATPSRDADATATPTATSAPPGSPSPTIQLPIGSATPNPPSPTVATPSISTPDGTTPGDSSPVPSPSLTTTPGDGLAGARTPATGMPVSTASPSADASPTPIAPNTGTEGPSLPVSRALTMAALGIILLGGVALVFLYGSES